MKYDYFLSGPITGVADFRERFASAVSRVQAHRPGARVWNPAALPAGKSYAWYMKKCVAALFVSRAVVCLDGYEASPGAMAEMHLARALHKPVLGKLSDCF